MLDSGWEELANPTPEIRTLERSYDENGADAEIHA